MNNDQRDDCLSNVPHYPLKRVLVPVTNPLGGIRTYMLYNLRRLHEGGYRFTFLSGAGPLFDSFKQDVADWTGTEFVDVPAGSGTRGTVQAIRNALSKERFALIHSQGLRAGTEVSAANFFRKVPHLITLHDVIVPQNDIPGRFKGLKRAIISYLVRQASVLVPVSNDCRDNHVELFPAWKKGPARIEPILNGIDVRRILDAREKFAASDAPRIRTEFHWDGGKVLGGFFGRFMPQKGFNFLLDALAILAQKGYEDRFRLIATRDPNGYLNEYVKDATDRPGVGKMVRFVESVPEIAPLLSQVDVLVMPSIWEACGLLAMEAMVLGVPVIGSDCLGLREVLRDTPSFAPKHADADALARTIISFLDSPTTGAAREFAPTAQSRFDIRIATDKLLRIYRELSSLPNS